MKPLSFSIFPIRHPAFVTEHCIEKLRNNSKRDPHRQSNYPKLNQATGSARRTQHNAPIFIIQFFDQGRGARTNSNADLTDHKKKNVEFIQRCIQNRHNARIA